MANANNGTVDPALSAISRCSKILAKLTPSEHGRAWAYLKAQEEEKARANAAGSGS